MKNFNFEVLSPVGNKEMAVAAVRSGADAVYLGAKEFNARRNAENFTDEELKSTVEYCKKYGVKVYLTLNIILSDKEMEKALEISRKAYEYGIDAIIATDFGYISKIRKLYPEIDIHASTQMTVHSPSALYPLKELGIKRVVLARELSFEKIKEITFLANKLGMETEVFVHGALCMCMSGQCLLSSFLGGRSGNRGKCAGPCRLPFSADKETAYDLSLKDLSLIKHLDKLKNAGVTSFKIEGRMKRPEYVSVATKAVKSALLNGKPDAEAEDLLKSVFSRSGFTDGYFIEKLNKDMFGIRTKEDVINSSSAFPKIHEYYKNEPQNIPVTAVFSASENKSELTLSNGENSVILMGNAPSKAKSKPIDREYVLTYLSKTGGTPYFIEKAEITVGDGLYIPPSTLNELRRNALECLTEKRKHHKELLKKDIELPKSEKIHNSKKLYVRAEDISLLENPDSFDGVIIPAENIKEKYECNIIAELPRGIDSEENLIKTLKQIKNYGVKTVSAGNIAALHLAKENGFDCISGFGLNIYNSFCCEYFENYGVKGIILSPEMTVSEINSISSNTEIGIIAYGKIPLMLTKNCPIKNKKTCLECNKNSFLTDRKGVKFPVKCRNSFSEIYNSVPVFLSDKRDEFRVDFGVLYFTNESKEEIEDVISLYKNGNRPDCEYTRGLYFRGVE